MYSPYFVRGHFTPLTTQISPTCWMTLTRETWFSIIYYCHFKYLSFFPPMFMTLRAIKFGSKGSHICKLNINSIIVPTLLCTRSLYSVDYSNLLDMMNDFDQRNVIQHNTITPLLIFLEESKFCNENQTKTP